MTFQESPSVLALQSGKVLDRVSHKCAIKSRAFHNFRKVGRAFRSAGTATARMNYVCSNRCGWEFLLLTYDIERPRPASGGQWVTPSRFPRFEGRLPKKASGGWRPIAAIRSLAKSMSAFISARCSGYSAPRIASCDCGRSKSISLKISISCFKRQFHENRTHSPDRRRA